MSNAHREQTAKQDNKIVEPINFVDLNKEKLLFASNCNKKVGSIIFLDLNQENCDL